MLRIYEVMLKFVQSLRPVIEQIEAKDRDLGKQMRRAVCSMVLNTGEGMGSRGGTRRERYRNALGSARETNACLDVARALDYTQESPVGLLLIINTLVKLSA